MSDKSQDYDRRTIYLNDKKAFERWLKEMDLEYDVIYDTEKRRLHTLMISFIQSREKEFVDYVWRQTTKNQADN